MCSSLLPRSVSSRFVCAFFVLEECPYALLVAGTTDVKSCMDYAIITLELMILSNAFEQFDTIKLFKLCMIFKLCFLIVFAEQAEIV